MFFINNYKDYHFIHHPITKFSGCLTIVGGISFLLVGLRDLTYGIFVDLPRAIKKLTSEKQIKAFPLVEQKKAV